MEDYSKREVQYARYIVDQLLGDKRARLDIGSHIVISDLQRDAADFSSDLELLGVIGEDVPAIRIADSYLAPMSLSSFVGPKWIGYPRGPSWGSRPWRFNPFVRKWARDLVRSLKRGGGSPDGDHTMSREEARSTYAEHATDFLATRIAAVKNFFSRGWEGVTLLHLLQQKGGARVSTPGTLFTISTNSPGLRVFWSGAYRISSNYFGHPTTPTTSVLQSGTYVFGVDGGAYGNVIRWDSSAVVRLPGRSDAHLNF